MGLYSKDRILLYLLAVKTPLAYHGTELITNEKSFDVEASSGLKRQQADNCTVFPPNQWHQKG